MLCRTEVIWDPTAPTTAILCLIYADCNGDSNNNLKEFYLLRTYYGMAILNISFDCTPLSIPFKMRKLSLEKVS